MDISDLIKAIRSQLGMSQEAFAEAIHVAFSTVNRWENNKSTPNSMARMFIADYCEKNGVDKKLVAAIKKDKGRR
ncbi:MAG: helix-turn-helix domain-containing protein [Oscillospiraceae bacterium]|nr:helix-turn-helix domain-containing protein [Oscillospiraceae bacterium]